MAQKEGGGGGFAKPKAKPDWKPAKGYAEDDYRRLPSGQMKLTVTTRPKSAAGRGTPAPKAPQPRLQDSHDRAVIPARPVGRMPQVKGSYSGRPGDFGRGQWEDFGSPQKPPKPRRT
jgi:hypothetical protein